MDKRSSLLSTIGQLNEPFPALVHGSSHTSHRFWRPHGRRQLSGRWWCRPLSDRGLVEQFDRNIFCLRITQSFEYSNVIEAEGEVYTWGVGSDFWCYDLLCLLLPGHDCEASRPEQRTSDMSDGEIQDNEQIYLSSLCCLDNNVNWQLDRFRYIDTTRVILLGLTQINLLFL